MSQSPRVRVGLRVLLFSSLSLAACIDVDGLQFGGSGTGGGNPSGPSSTSGTASGGGAGQGGAGTGGSAAPSYAEVVLSDQPLAYYRFEEQPGTAIAADSSPSDFEAIVLESGGGYVRGVPGAIAGEASLATRLEGGAYVLLSPNNLDLGTHTSYSLEAWIHAEGTPFEGSLFRWREDGTPQSGFQTYLGLDVVQHKRYDTGGSYEDLYLSPTYLGGGFHHLVVTVSPPNARIYVDGVLATNPGFDGFALELPTHSAPLSLADTGSSTTLVVDEIAYYPHALSQARVEAHYRCGTGSACELAP